jgi:glycerol-1-phosphate dehydrogenase [NAD(P)+]
MKTIWPVPKIVFQPLSEIDEKRPVALVTSGPAWNVVRNELRLPVAWLGEVTEATTESWDALFQDCQGDVIYSVGGGLPVDAAKYLAVQKNLPLICVPTALSVDAFVTWASGIRVSGAVQYIETTIPSKLIVDLDIIAAAPPALRAAGLCDVLSIATGLWDWKFAEEHGKNPSGMEYIPAVEEIARGILHLSLDNAASAGAGEKRGLKHLLDSIVLETQLLNHIGHARPEEGSEHYFAYLVENKIGHGRPHAELVCPGTLVIAQLQGQDITPLKQAMLDTNLPLNTIPMDTVIETLLELPEYAKANNYPFGIAHTITREQVENLDINNILYSS